MYLSYDSGKLTSTLINLDIEELSYCLAGAVEKHIQFTENQTEALDDEKEFTDN